MELPHGGVFEPVESDQDQPGEATERERANDVGELSPIPEDAGGDSPPEHDALAELEESVGRLLSEDLTTEATQIKGDEKE